MIIKFWDLLDSTKYDGKKYTWKNVYDIVYKQNMDVSEKMEYKNNRYQRFMEFEHNGKKSKKMYYSGDINFNFFDDAPQKPGKRRLCTEMKIILQLEKDRRGDSNIEEITDIEIMLDNVINRTERKANVSIIPSTGGLQFVKQAVGRDRLDTFVWCLDEHYRNNNTILLNHCAAKYMDDLKSFLNLFTSAEEYCECIYNISSDMTKKLRDSGSKPIDTYQRVKEYIILANQFWHERIEYFIELGMNNPQGR